MSGAQQLEGAKGLGGYVRFYPVTALAEAGAHVDTYANWHSNVVVDRELITGQQPMSAEEFGEVLVARLNSAVVAHAQSTNSSERSLACHS